MAKTKKELLKDYEQKNTRVNEILDARGDDEFTSDEVKELDRLEKEIGDIEGELTAFKAADGARDRARDRDAFLNEPTGRPAQGKGNARGEVKTLGRNFVDSEAIAGYLKSIKGSDGRISDQVHINSPAVAADNLLKALIMGSSDTSAGALITPDRQPGVIVDPFRILTLRDLITLGQTTSDTVEYVRQTSRTNNAGMTAEATATGNGSGAAPESAMAFAVEQTNVKDITHWIPATKRAISDASQVATYVDNFLLFGLEEKLEVQAVTGDGTGDNLLGILNTPGIQEQVFATDILTTIRKARTKAKKKGVTPSAILMNAETWEKFDLSKDDNGRYHFGGPAIMGNPRLWGLPVVESETLANDVALVADFRWATLWDREAGNISMSDSHADFFTRRMVAILGALRAAFAVLYPQAFVKTALVAA